MSRVSVRRPACESCPVRPPPRPTLRPLYSRRPRARGAAVSDERSGVAGVVIPGRSALHKSLEAGAGPTFGEGNAMTRAADPQTSFADLEFFHQGVQLDPLLQ